MMKRRNVDCVKPRRPLKRNKISEGIYGSFVVYIKFALVWLLVLAADYLLDFRFEYLWPFWLLLRSVYDSFRYQGLAFCVLFLCMAVTADMVAIVFIPASWLFFAASTYVWVQFVWHTERGVCLPTIVLWALFIYIEAVVRLKEVKNVPFHMDLCRPFAAHCIGYPVVTLGFGLKSYVGYRLRQRKQREVARENEFYVQLLQEALPPDLQQLKNMSTAAAHAAAAVVKEYEDTETGETEINGPTSTSSAASGSRGSGGGSSRSNAASVGGDAAGSGSWSKDCSTLPSLPFLTKLRKGTTQWWRSWLTKPDNIYKNGSSHTLNNCLVNSTVSNSSTSSSSSSCSSSSSSSNSSCSSHRGVSAATVARSSVKGGDLGGGGVVGNTKEGVGGGGGSMASTPNGFAVHHHHHHHNTSNSYTTAVAVTATTTTTTTSSPSPPPPSSPPPSSATANKHSSKVANNALHAQLEYMQKQGVSSRSVNNFDESAAEPDKTAKNSNNSTTATDAPEKNKNKSNATQHQSNGSAKVAVSHTNNLRGDASTGGGGGGGTKKSKNKDTNRDTAAPPPRDEGLTIIRLESDLKRARSELNSSRNSEQDLRNQVNTLVGNQKQCQQELAQLQQDNDTLQNKLHGLVTARQSDRLSLSGLERRVAEERRGRQAAEAQLQQLDRRNRKLEEQQQLLQRQHQTKSSSGECSDSCRARRAELEAEVKRLRRDHRAQEDKTRAFERENITLRQYKESQNDNEVLMSALSAMQERNTTLESTLSAETRIKLDLLSALGDIKRQLQIAQGHVERKDKDIEELKAKFTEVLAVCPATSFSSTTLHTNSTAPQPYHYSSKLLLPQVSNSMESSLPPNLVNDLNLESLVVGLGFPSSLPPHSPSVQQLSGLSFPSQQPPISPPTPGPISPPCNNSQSPNPPQHSNLDPNARIYTPKGVNGQGQNAQDN